MTNEKISTTERIAGIIIALVIVTLVLLTTHWLPACGIESTPTFLNDDSGVYSVCLHKDWENQDDKRTD